MRVLDSLCPLVSRIPFQDSLVPPSPSPKGKRKVPTTDLHRHPVQAPATSRWQWKPKLVTQEVSTAGRAVSGHAALKNSFNHLCVRFYGHWLVVYCGPLAWEREGGGRE